MYSTKVAVPDMFPDPKVQKSKKISVPRTHPDAQANAIQTLSNPVSRFIRLTDRCRTDTGRRYTSVDPGAYNANTAERHPVSKVR
jgi:hypothetical protein